MWIVGIIYSRFAWAGIFTLADLGGICNREEQKEL